jgi:mRNA interferase RelE/StbE
VSFAVLLHPKAAKSLGKMGEPTGSRIKEELLELTDKPEQAGKPLKYSDFWSLRVGDYRVIYQIDNAHNQVIILFIGHRRNVYDDFSKMF